MAWDASLADVLRSQPPTVPRDIEQITGEILSFKVTFSQSAWDIGTRLIEAKELLSHGEWLPWLEQSVDISVRTANSFMSIVRNYPNSQALANLGATKVITLLAVPAEEREEFIEATHIVNGQEKTVAEMSSRELQQAIKERDEAIAQVAERQERIDQLEEASVSVTELQSEVTKLTGELFALRAAPVEVAVMEIDQKTIDDAKAEAVAQMQVKLDKAKAAQAKAEEKRAALADKLEVAQNQVATLQSTAAKAVISADKEVTTFEAFFVQTQENINKMSGLLMKVRGRDQETGEKLSRALLALSELIQGVAK